MDNSNNPKKILVAEDSDFLMKVYDVKLSKAGFEIIKARNGNEAIELAKQHIPSLIILDNLMPEKDGLTCLKELKQDPATQSIPTIILSNSEDPTLEKEAIASGAKDFILKVKLKSDDLISLLESYMDQ